MAVNACGKNKYEKNRASEPNRALLEALGRLNTGLIESRSSAGTRGLGGERLRKRNRALIER